MLDKIDINHLGFVDESGVNLGMNRLDCRAKIGDRLVEQCPRNKGKNLSVIGALSRDGLIASMTIEGSTDSAVFQIYVESVLVPMGKKNW